MNSHSQDPTKGLPINGGDMVRYTLLNFLSSVGVALR